MDVAMRPAVSERMMAAAAKAPEPGVTRIHTPVVYCNFKARRGLHTGIIVQARDASNSILKAPACRSTKSRESSTLQPAAPECGRLAWAETPRGGSRDKSS